MHCLFLQFPALPLQLSEFGTPMPQLMTLSVRVRSILSLMFIFSVLPHVVYTAATKFSDGTLSYYLNYNRAGLAMLNAP